MAKKKKTSIYNKSLKELQEKLRIAEEERKKSLEGLLSKLFYKIFDNEENEELLIFLEENSGNKIFIEEIQKRTINNLKGLERDITSGKIVIKEEKEEINSEKKEKEITNLQLGD